MALSRTDRLSILLPTTLLFSLLSLVATFPSFESSFAEVLPWLPCVIFCRISFPMDIIVFLSPLLPMSGNLVDFVFVCHFVIRRRCHKLWSWSKIKLYSGNVDCRMRSRVGGEPECDGIRSDFGDLEWSIRNRGKFPLFAFLPFQQYPISFYDQYGSRFFSYPYFGAGLAVHHLLHLGWLLANIASIILYPQHVDCQPSHAK